MKTAVTMQNIFIRIALKHHLDLNASEAHLRLEQDGFMPLVIEKIGKHLVSVAHYDRQNGDTIADPDVVFFTGYGEWVPIQITQSLGGFLEAARVSPDSCGIESYKPKTQADLAAFCRMWAGNLSAQGWMDAAPAESHDVDRMPNETAVQGATQEPVVTPQ